MTSIPSPDELPLRSSTPRHWAHGALRQLKVLLNDHAHLEKKAAINALDLLGRWPTDASCEEWTRTLTSVSEDEAVHLTQVVRLMRRHGWQMTKTHSNPYAQRLHAWVRRGTGPHELLDRLLISSIVEARSCERFWLLGQAAENQDLRELYRVLWASEHGHYRVFHSLGAYVAPPHEVSIRWHALLEYEAQLMHDLPPGPSMHAGIDGYAD